jgi:hypothetical protein
VDRLRSRATANGVRILFALGAVDRGRSRDRAAAGAGPTTAEWREIATDSLAAAVGARAAAGELGRSAVPAGIASKAGGGELVSASVTGDLRSRKE